MGRPRVFMICVNQLVCEAVNLVLRREGIELLGMESDAATALRKVRALEPEVVLVEGHGQGEPGPDEAEDGLMTALARFLYEGKKLRIVRLCLPDGELRIYRCEQRRLVDAQDLIAAICDPPVVRGSGDIS
ncbi:MAG: hypothetical protein M1132_02710 [Chloroflexi bacterium]|nr:hypothetical protein [Chloroflexota bacterium]